jgi:hypothetical protein
MPTQEDAMALTPRYTKHELAALLAAIHPEEDRPRFTKAKWNGNGFRHYRDPKIVCIEHYMPRARSPKAPVAGRPGHKPAA